MIALLGILISCVILISTFMHSKAGIQVFLNPEGLGIVLGGSLAIFLMSSQGQDIVQLLRIFKSVLSRKAKKEKLKQVLLSCTDSILKGQIPSKTGHEFLDKCLEWYGAGLRGATLEKLMVDGAKLELERNQNAIQILSNLTKYPPALGMVGTVFGIIAIFNGLNQADGQKHLGANLAFAMTATLYGLITANFIVSPLAEFLTQAAAQDETDLAMIVESVKLWGDRESKFFIEETLELFHAS